MDAREGMALSGSAPYYLHRPIGGVSSGAGVGVGPFNPPPGFRNLPNPNNFRVSAPIGSSAFNVKATPSSFPPHGFPMPVDSSPDTAGAGAGAGGEGSFSGSGYVKKKRGRPRKYGLEGSGVGSGSVCLGLSPLSSPKSNASSEKRKRGRPPGSGRKQRLAFVGEWMSNSAGLAFTPHVIYISPGEDIASKILSFAQQRPRALCIMSASGGVSLVTLRQPASSVGSVTYEGQFEILCLSGSYLVAETGGPRNRSGGVNISLSSHDGQVIGGSVADRLVASKPVQVVVCSFVYGGQKPDTSKAKAESDSKGEKSSSDETGDNAKTGLVRNPDTDIDLMRG